MPKKQRPQMLSPLTSQKEERDKGSDVTHGHKTRKRARAEADDAAEERRLTAMLFGGQEEVDSELAVPRDDDESDEADDAMDPSALFQLDRLGAGDDRDVQSSIDGGEQSDGEHPSGNPAWVDEDDERITANILTTNRLRKLRTSQTEALASALPGTELEKRLRKRFEDTTMATARTDWARIDHIEASDVEDEGENLLGSSSAPLLASSSHRLPPQMLSVVRCPDANLMDPNNAVVQAVNFHPGSDPDRPLMLTAGLDKTLRFFHVDDKESEKVHGIHFPKLPIYSASFLGDTGNVVVSGRRPFFYIYDAVAGKLDLLPKILGREEKSLEKLAVSPDGRTIAFVGNDGYILLVDAKTRHWIADLKMNGSVRSVTFTPDGEYIVGSGSDGDIYRWELKSRQCVERFSNEDGTITASLSASMKHLAVGAESGVVNLYSEHGNYSSSSKSPLKSIMNLHTSADLTKFNHDGQILALSSRREKHGMKLLHVPTATVFSNWPTSKTPLNYVWSMDFSPQSKFMAVGNDKGKCLLYKLLHYHEDSNDG